MYMYVHLYAHLHVCVCSIGHTQFSHNCSHSFQIVTLYTLFMVCITANIHIRTCTCTCTLSIEPTHTCTYVRTCTYMYMYSTFMSIKWYKGQCSGILLNINEKYFTISGVLSLLVWIVHFMVIYNLYMLKYLVLRRWYMYTCKNIEFFTYMYMYI